ncbi:MELK kinase, partial [Drymodes brunneopygia]|nr:MELK kinase [Drymodes brunneopygia]
MVRDDHEEILKCYELQGTISTGVFAKVKLTWHHLTGEKVTIKPWTSLLYRMTWALEHVQRRKQGCWGSRGHSLKLHQGKFRSCPRGERFDSIISKDRLSEEEAHGFFQQIVSAIAYMHCQGCAHRDLKPETPETELIDKEHNLIDFGLCAKPKGGLGYHLNTFCGSPAPAAPEMIQGKAYMGSEAVIWSLGVVLYTLLCD